MPDIYSGNGETPALQITRCDQSEQSALQHSVLPLTKRGELEKTVTNYCSVRLEAIYRIKLVILHAAVIRSRIFFEGLVFESRRRTGHRNSPVAFSSLSRNLLE